MPSMEQIWRDHPRQWLAVKVTEEDPQTHTAKAGEVVAEAEGYDEIWDKVASLKVKELFVFFSGPPLKEGYVAAF